MIILPKNEYDNLSRNVAAESLARQASRFNFSSIRLNQILFFILF